MLLARALHNAWGGQQARGPCPRRPGPCCPHRLLPLAPCTTGWGGDQGFQGGQAVHPGRVPGQTPHSRSPASRGPSHKPPDQGGVLGAWGRSSAGLLCVPASGRPRCACVTAKRVRSPERCRQDRREALRGPRHRSLRSATPVVPGWRDRHVGRGPHFGFPPRRHRRVILGELHAQRGDTSPLFSTLCLNGPFSQAVSTLTLWFIRRPVRPGQEGCSPRGGPWPLLLGW